MGKESSKINKKLFENLKKLNLPLGEYAVFGSGPMGIRNLRDMHDIDLVVTQDLFDQFKNNPNWETKDIHENNDCFRGLINRKLDIEMRVESNNHDTKTALNASFKMTPKLFCFLSSP